MSEKKPPKPALKLQPDTASTFTWHGDEHARQGAFEQAIEAYRKSLELEPEAAYVHFQLGLALFELERKEEAIAAFVEATRLAPTQRAPAFNLGNAYFDLQRYAEAADAYLEAIQRDPQDAESPYNLGKAFNALERQTDAARAYLQAARLDPTHRRAISNLARTLFEIGARLDAAEWQEKAVALAPDVPEEQFSLGQILSTIGRLPEAVAAFRKVVELEPAATTAYESLGQCLYELGRKDELRELADRWNQACPNDPRAIHMTAAWHGTNVAPRAPNDYVKSLFDEFAPGFDKTLERLEYRAPEVLGSLLIELHPQADRNLTILDAGCGTGLCGPWIRPAAQTLIGVDLSPGMLAEAEKRQIYDELVTSDLEAYLTANPRRFDAIVSADTLVYFGDLTAVLAAAAAGLRPGGTLIFSLENNTTDPTAAGFRLNASGRYSHSEAYLRERLQAAGLQLRELRFDTLRKEKGTEVPGWVVAAVLPAV